MRNLCCSISLILILMTWLSAGNEPVATFSIVAADTASGELGIAVASRFFAVGNVVPWAQAGGDSRGKQSAAMLVVKDGAGYGGYTDRAIDIRVDDHPEPFVELGRLLKIARMNYAWNEAWTLFTQQRSQEALPHIERAVKLDPDYPELLYDQAVIYLAAGQPAPALQALEKCLRLNPKLKSQAAVDGDLEALGSNKKFQRMIK